MKIVKFVREGWARELPDAFYRVSVKLFIKDESDKLLVEKDKTNGFWEIPGGGLDHGEGMRQTAEREIREELGVALIAFGSMPIVITTGLHPNNYTTLMLYCEGALSDYNFSPEDKFETKFIGREEFLRLKMLGDESPIQKYVDKIWHA